MNVKSRSKKVNKAWLHDHLNDPYVRRAQAEGYRSRAAYKLAEIDEAFRLLRPGHTVVDLGAAPGAWSQYLRRRLGAEAAGPGGVGPRTTLLALDLLPMEPIDGVLFLQGDFREDESLRALEAALRGRPVDVVISDMAPNLSGVASADAARMADLVELAVDFAERHLRPDGVLVAKVFHGSGYSQLVERFKRSFRLVKPHKPKASRARSAETFLVGIGPKAEANPRQSA
ncbi:MAG: rRNA methyltransferase [Rubrivivax sp. SCN 71-131]|nr:MAG: rRNA methyltransferase [Rubrivivax sp. SCN 71-131]